MSSVVRTDEVKTKKVIVLKAASCIKEWSKSGASNGPRRRAWALGSVDLQWGWEVWRMSR